MCLRIVAVVVNAFRKRDLLIPVDNGFGNRIGGEMGLGESFACRSVASGFVVSS